MASAQLWHAAEARQSVLMRGAAAAAPTTDAAAESSNASQRAQPSVFTGACDINSALTNFRTALGALDPNVVGEQNGGRREVNWDAVPPAFTNTLNFPGDFFNQNFSPRARGVVFSTDGSGLSVSNNDFKFINAAYDAQFNSFSPVRTFSAIGSNTTRVDLFVAGTSTPARSTGFGVVFSDVDEWISVYQAARPERQQPGRVPCAAVRRRILLRRRQFPIPLVAAIRLYPDMDRSVPTQSTCQTATMDRRAIWSSWMTSSTANPGQYGNDRYAVASAARGNVTAPQFAGAR